MIESSPNLTPCVRMESEAQYSRMLSHLRLLYRCALVGLIASIPIGCRRHSSQEALQLVLRYNNAVAEAYRQGDVKFALPVVGSREEHRIGGLIGARSEFGMVLDSELLRLEVLHTEYEGDALSVRTHESWSYLDRRASTGKPVGLPHRDEYDMVYMFKRDATNWLVDEIRFALPPKIGRTNSIWSGTPTRPMAGETNATTLSIPYSTRLD